MPPAKNLLLAGMMVVIAFVAQTAQGLEAVKEFREGTKNVFGVKHKVKPK